MPSDREIAHRDRQDGHEAGGLRGDQCRDPDPLPDVVGRGRERVDDEQRDAGVDRELGGVEDELDRRQPAVEQHHHALPSRQPTTNASALQKIKPNTIGMSPSENECAPRRKWRWTTQRSAIANAIAIDHHGRCGCERG